MKTKSFQTALVISAIALITIVTTHMLKDNFSFLRVEFLPHGEDCTQHFINLFIY